MNLKKQIITLLIEEDAEENFQLLQDPSYHEDLDNMVKQIAATTVEMIKEDDDEGIDDEESEELFQDCYSALKEIFNSVDQKKELAHNLAKSRYMPVEEMEKKPQDLLEIKDLKEEIGEEAFKKLKKEINKLIRKNKSFEDFKEQVLTQSIKVAKKDGLEKAVKPRTQSKIIQGIIPTAAAYIDLNESGWDSNQEFLLKFQEIIKTDDEEENDDDFEASLYQISLSVMKQVFLDIVERSAKKIYNL